MPIDRRTLLGVEIGDFGLEAAGDGLARERAGERRFADAAFLRDECDDRGHGDIAARS